jgi:carbamoyl-phosphate synthase large subunit
MKNLRVFVTGGAGVIGCELIPMLLAEGAYVIVGDLKDKPNGWDDEVDYLQGDLNDLTKQSLESINPDIIFHLAATFERSVKSLEFWDENYANNISLTHHILRISRNLGSLKRFVLASSYLIYDPSQYLFNAPQESARQLSESHTINPRNLIGMAKLQNERELQFLSNFKQSTFSSVSVRIFRGFGKGSRCVISRWIRDLLSGNEIVVFRPEGSFDFIYARESAEGLLRIAMSNISGVINLGSGRATRISTVIEILKTHFPGSTVRYVNSDITYEASAANIDKLTRTLNWSPNGQIENQIAEIIEFERTVHTTPLRPTSEKFGILVTSSSGKLPLIDSISKQISQTYKNINVCVGDYNSNTLSGLYLSNFLTLPKTNDSSLIPFLDLLTENGIRVVVPTRDGELEFFARHLTKFQSRNISVMVSGMDSIKTCGDKLAFYASCEHLALRCIQTAINIDYIKNALRYVVKERFGSASQSIGLNLSKNGAIQHAKSLENPIFQEYIDGTEFSVDSFVSQLTGFVGCVIRTRDLVVGGESKVSTIIEDVNIDHIVRSLLVGIGVQGHSVTQIIVNENGYHIVECNPRLGGASTLAMESGLKSVNWYIDEQIFHMKIEDFKINKAYLGMSMNRIQKDIFR